jgi:hypothetical protein
MNGRHCVGTLALPLALPLLLLMSMKGFRGV